VGYFAVLTTTGRRSGLPRRTPLNYAVRDGAVYLLAGFGPGSDWYRNLVAHPEVTLRLPGRVVRGTARPVTDPEEAARGALAVCRNSGFALAFLGLPPLVSSDRAIRRRVAGLPVVRVDAHAPVRPGRHDPGSAFFLLPHVVLPAALVLGARAVRARARGGWAPRASRRSGGSGDPALLTSGAGSSRPPRPGDRGSSGQDGDGPPTSGCFTT
jgi:deazaflavin-dependent oxidoreductase (nitroreductase family)